ncbi:hypothetical protein HDV05_001786 [Chytridiales sp. JEL 0842]|nr:hypothetical protein HDV05_001786 [Chytridiales sp. JEL 0842]
MSPNLKSSDEVVVMDFDGADDDDEQGGQSKMIVGREEVELCLLLQSMKILAQMILTSAGRSCFPVSLLDGQQLTLILQEEPPRNELTAMDPAKNGDPDKQNSDTLNLASTACNLLCDIFSNYNGESILIKADLLQLMIKPLKSNTSLDHSTFDSSVLIYRTFEGLGFLQEYKIHVSLAKALVDRRWKPALAQAGLDDEEWRSTLVDNLLNFAATPKGLLFLKDANCLDACASHMYTRYVRKLQVSSCEKFGYGVLVSQISTTEPGMEALYKSGMIKSLVKALYDEFDGDSLRPYDRINLEDKRFKKVLTGLMKALCSFSGLSAAVSWEAKSMKPPGHIDKHGVLYLLSNLALLKKSTQTNETIFSFEDMHIVGLRLLNLLVSSLDNYLLLESLLHFQSSLIDIQKRFRRQSDMRSSQTSALIDETVLARNNILATTYFVGGPSERIILPKNEKEVVGEIDIISAYPPPSSYWRSIDFKAPKMHHTDMKVLKELETLLSVSVRDIKDYDKWFSTLQDIFVKLVDKIDMVGAFRPLISKALQLLKSVLPKVTQTVAESHGWIALSSQKQLRSLQSVVEKGSLPQLSEADRIGVSLTIRYFNTIFPPGQRDDMKGSLIELMRKTRYLLVDTARQDTSKQPSKAFDWFLATVFGLCDGSSNDTYEILSLIYGQMPSLFLWPFRSLHLSETPTEVPLIYSCSCHLIEGILEDELPSVASAFTLSGCTPSQISERWLRECFWNVLDFSDIISYVSSVLILGVDYQIYFCISILRHVEKDILVASREGDLINFLHEATGICKALHSFKSSNYFLYMGQLKKKYRQQIIGEMRNQVFD